MSSTLISHVDTRIRTREELATLATPAPTKSWKPISHSDLVHRLVEDFKARGIAIVREQYATGGRNDVKLFGVMDLRVDGLDTPELGTSLGLRGANDKSMAIQVIAAARVFVCDNMAFSGSDGAVVLKKKHTSRLDLSEVVPPAIESYLEKQGAWRLDIEKMKDFALDDDRAKAVIYESFLRRNPVLPIRLLPAVHGLYFDDDEQRAKFEARSLWSLSNSYTEAVKALTGIPQQRYGVEVGRYFGRVLHAGRGNQVAIPVAPPIGDTEHLGHLDNALPYPFPGNPEARAWDNNN